MEHLNSKTELYVKRTQWAVGNGFFHSAKLKVCSEYGTKQHTFNYIYDCGSSEGKKILRREINEYVKQNPGNVDICFISHFDRDHIIGIPILHKKISVDYFAIPVIEPHERLFHLTEHIVQKITKDGNGNFPPEEVNQSLINDIEQFLIDVTASPVDTLAKLTSDPNNSRRRIIQIHPTDTSIRATIDPPRISWPASSTTPRTANQPNDTLTVEVEGGEIRLSYRQQNIWEWEARTLTDYSAPNKNSGNSAASEFKKYLEENCQDDSIKQMSDMFCAEAIRKWVANESNLNVLARAYQKSCGKRNKTSLMLFSGPPKKSPHSFVNYYFDKLQKFNYHQHLDMVYECMDLIENNLLLPANSIAEALGIPSMYSFRATPNKLSPTELCPVGWLGLGDVEGAGNPGNWMPLINEIWKDRKKQTRTLAISHHGSKHNWHKSLLDDFQFPPLCIMSTSGRKYRHPDSEVVREIYSSGSLAYIITDAPITRYVESISVSYYHP